MVLAGKSSVSRFLLKSKPFGLGKQPGFESHQNILRSPGRAENTFIRILIKPYSNPENHIVFRGRFCWFQMVSERFRDFGLLRKGFRLVKTHPILRFGRILKKNMHEASRPSRIYSYE